jgi:hypothetical protein
MPSPAAGTTCGNWSAKNTGQSEPGRIHDQGGIAVIPGTWTSIGRLGNIVTSIGLSARAILQTGA